MIENVDYIIVAVEDLDAAENNYKKIETVCEDTLNPCVNELLKIYPNIN